MALQSRIIGVVFARLRRLKYHLLSDNTIIGHKPVKNGPVLFSGKGEIRFGAHVQLGYKASPLFYSHYGYIEARTKHSKIEIGDEVVINNNFNIVAMAHISIQEKCTIGVNFSILDSDFHHLEPHKRNADNPPSAPVMIGKNVFIGNNVTVLKGVTIGDNAVVGNGSIVTQSIPKNTVVGGNPARVIKMV